MRNPIRIIVANPNALFRLGVVSFLREQPGVDVVGEAGDGNEVLAKAKQLRPDLVLMEMDMSGINGLEATRFIKDALPKTRVVMLTGSQEHMADAINTGVQGYLPQGIDPHVLVATLKRICRGEIHIAGHGNHIQLSGFAHIEDPVHQEPGEDLVSPRSRREDSLSPRQQEVLTHLSTGVTNKEIAQSLGISENTVKNHVKGILAKLQVQNRSQALAFALRAGIVKPLR